MVRVAVALIVLLAGCDALFQLDHIGPSDAKHGDGSSVDGSSQSLFKQSAFNTVSGSGVTTAQVTLLDAPTAGDTLVLMVGYTSAASAPFGIGDGKNTWMSGAAPLLQNGLGQAAYYATSIEGTARTVTVTFPNTGASDVDLRLVEYRGLAGYLGSSSKAGVASNGGMMSSNPLAVLGSQVTLCVAGFIVSGLFDAPGPGFVERVTTDNGNFVEDEVLDTGPVTATATQTQNGAYIVQLLAFRTL